MKAINYDFDNLGGLLKLYAIPPSSFVRVIQEYASQQNRLELRNREDIMEIPVYADSTYSYSEDKEVNDAGDCWNVSIEGVIPKTCSGNHRMLETLERELWYVLAVDGNGEAHWCGQEDALLIFNTHKSSGKSAADRNGTTFTFSCIQDEPTIFIADPEGLAD